MKKCIADGIENYIKADKKPWHMPGHKRKTGLNPAFEKDFTEVPGLDDLHHPEEMIKESMTEAAAVYDTYKSYYLVNGSTAGILAGIYAMCEASTKMNKALLIARNCHKSVFNAALLLGIKAVYIYPEYLMEGRLYGRVTVDKVKEAIEKHPNLDFVGLVVTSPTYEGVISDIEEIGELCHERGIRLLTDEAHGAHLPFNDSYGNTAINGADIVVQSLHKTLPSLTQTAIVHITKKAADIENLAKCLEKYLAVFQTSSPSYIFLEAIESCIAYCDEKREAFSEHLKRVDAFRSEAKNLKNLTLFEPEVEFDRSRITFFLDRITGDKAKEMLEAEGIVIEMSGADYIVLISSVMDSDEDFKNLLNIFLKLDREIELIDNSEETYDDKFYISTDKGQVEISEAEGLRISNYIYVYPPGIPIIAPFEVITRDMINEVKLNLRAGKEIRC